MSVPHRYPVPRTPHACRCRGRALLCCPVSLALLGRSPPAGSPALALHWPYTGPALALHWPCTGPAKASKYRASDSTSPGHSGSPARPGPCAASDNKSYIVYVWFPPSILALLFQATSVLTSENKTAPTLFVPIARQDGRW